MTLTLTIDDQTANDLDSWARSRAEAPEQFAADLLRTALEHLPGFESWKRLNSRRLDLIEKRRAAGLSSTETEELEDLQAFTAKLAGPSDDAMLEKLAEVEPMTQSGKG
ncbi:MAG: hypothetical protein ACI8UO_002996 [Verrucomicrobiales bacterium]|jgi:hypothetical protein